MLKYFDTNKVIAVVVVVMSTECKEILERNLGSVADWSIKALL